MPQHHVVVDGSNIATEGRSLPSLGQLDQAVREFLADNPDDLVTVVVDASFGHRIDPSELPIFEEAENAGEVVSPPAGAIGRGDAFLLRIAEKTGATVLSNDSFQEFHGEHDWLFDEGRLIGGKPVPEVGWIFTPRTPVRGPKSREAVKEAKRKRRSESEVTPDGKPATGLDLAALRGRGRGKKVERAIARATEEAVEPEEGKRRRRRKVSEPPAEAVNEPLAFITFIAAHPLGGEVSGQVEEFSSHGAFVRAEGARCYVPLSAMGDPPPRKAREVLAKGEERTFAVQALDPQRRGIELAVPGFARIAGVPTAETVDAEIRSAAAAHPGRPVTPAPGARAARPRAAPRRAPAGGPPAVAATEGAGEADQQAEGVLAARKSPARKSPARKSPARKSPARKSPARKEAAAEAPAAGGAAQKVQKVAAKRVAPAPPPAIVDPGSPAKKAAPAKAAPAKKAAPAGKAPAKKAATGKAPAKKAAAPGPLAARGDAGVVIASAPAGQRRRAAAARRDRPATTGRSETL